MNKLTQENFSIPLDLLISKREDRFEDRFIGEMDAISMAALLLEYMPDIEERLLEYAFQARKDGLLVTDKNYRINYILGSRCEKKETDNATAA